MKEFLFSTLLLSAQNLLIEFAPLIVTTAVTSLVTWGVSSVRKLLASNEKLKNIQISKEMEDAILREALKIALSIEQKFSYKLTEGPLKSSNEKKNEAVNMLSVKFPNMNPTELGNIIETVLPDMRTIFNPNNPTTLVK
jgi:hypothetical protein